MRLVEKCRTLGDVFHEAAAEWPDKKMEFRGVGKTLTYAELAERARRIAGGLIANGVERGALVGLIQDNDPEFLLSFAAVTMAGAVPTPLPLPASAGGIAAFLQRIRGIIDNAGIQVVLVSPLLGQHLNKLGGLLEGLLDGVRLLACADLEDAPPIAPVALSADDLGLVQYTSGSTSAPKGVALRHSHVVASIDAIGLAIGLSSDDVNGQWLPLFHDMGLIGTLTGIAHGTSHYFWQPATFIRRPGSWLRQYAEVGGSIYAGPNFSYAYLLENVSPEKAAALDLSNWRIAFNGAESIDTRLMDAFIDRFAPAGLRAETMFPVYGLAEATLAVTFPKLGEKPFTLWVDREELTKEGRVIVCEPQAAGARGVVCVGKPIKGQELRIVANDGNQLPSGNVGEIEIRGTAVMDGYYDRSTAAATPSTDPQKWLPTGDLGFMWEERLFVTGRVKQLVIVRGQNYYPEDVEFEVCAIEGVYKGRSVAVMGYDGNGEESMVVIAETAVTDSNELDALARNIAGIVRDRAGIALGCVALVRKRSLRRTTNGKYQRILMGQLLRNGELASEILTRFVPGTAT